MNNTSRNYKESCERELNLISSAILICLSSLAGITAIVGNAFVMLAIRQTTTLRTVSNYFIASLAAADFSVGLTMYPVLIAKIALNIWQGEHWLSKTADFLWMQTTTTTTFNLCAVSVDRYIAITSVFKYHRIVTKRKSCRAIAFIWIFSLIFASLRLYVTNPDHYAKLWVATTLLTMVLPLIMIGFCYCRIYKEARSQSRKIAQNAISAEEAVLSAKNKKAAWTAAIIIGLFVVFWMPSFVASFVELFIEEPCQKADIDYAWFWIAVLSFSSSAFNPWVYTIRIQELRNTVRRIFHRRKIPREFSRTSRAASIAGRSTDWGLLMRRFSTVSRTNKPNTRRERDS